MVTEKLTPDELEALRSLEQKYEVIRVNTLLVANGDSSGMAVYGEGGIGKSWQILQTLEQAGRRQGKDYYLHNTRVSGSGLCQLLKAHPQEKDIHVIEDVESVFAEKICLGLLRSALWGQEDEDGRMNRVVTYRTAHDKHNYEFKFDGAVIFTMNGSINDVPELRALKTRIDVYNLVTERDEVFALAKKIALGGYSIKKGTVPPEMCLQMWAFYKEHLPQDASPDLRLLTRAYRKWLGLRNIQTTKTWQSLLLAQIHEGSKRKVLPENKREDIAAALRTKYGPKNWQPAVEEWRDITGLGKSTYFDTLKAFDRRR